MEKKGVNRANVMSAFLPQLSLLRYLLKNNVLYVILYCRNYIDSNARSYMYMY